MFKKVLVANRRESRCGDPCLQRTRHQDRRHPFGGRCRRHARPAADERLCVGPAESALGYRNIPNVLSAAEITGADAIHPGYGFLSENAHFAEVCESIGVKFIGPTSENIALMGDKAQAREIVSRPELPVTPEAGELKSEQEAGGGRQNRLSGHYQSHGWRWRTRDAGRQQHRRTRSCLPGGPGGSQVDLRQRQRVSRAVLPRASSHRSADCWRMFAATSCIWGSVIAPFNARHQKLVEETPSPAVDEKNSGARSGAWPLRRSRPCTTAIWARGIPARQGPQLLFHGSEHPHPGEHPITEMVTGIDLIKEQITLANGQPLSFKQPDIRLNGHSIECRINAEDPENSPPHPG